MSDRKYRGSAMTAAGMFLLYLAFLLAALHVVGTDANLYYRLQMKAEILPAAGISAEELKDADDALAKYLGGDPRALDGSPFNETEIAHMADCFDLFALLRKVLTVCAALAALFLWIGRRGSFRFGARAAAGILPTLIAALAVWGIADFDSLFTAFHRLLFRNELWLLDPRTDLLIRICPESMFAVMAAMIGGAELVFIGICIFLTSYWRKRHA